MKPVLFSVSYAGLWGQASLSLTDFVRKASELGYPAVEIMGKRPHLSILDATDETVSELRDAARSAGIEIATIAGYTDFTAGKTAAEVPFVEMQVAYVRTLARLGRELGASVVRVFTGYTTEPESAQRDWAKCVTAVRECAAAAHEYGLVLGVQNHHDVGVGTDSFLEFLNDVDHPNCRAMFDPWSPALHGDGLYECAKALAPHMVQTTFADYVRMKRFAYMPGLINYRELPAMVRAVPLGDGFVDLTAFWAGLKDGGFDGYVAYEMCSPLRGGGSMENLDATASKSLAFIHRLIAGTS
ncbi:MAG TPA: sugar phosphate isomerase/epimerase family protein [Candidatus Hydrogenedentes bacterium]|nr:sugar phosphate isomerase/epimerase family protein [Candidatus Hydrogenedentota bacterium]HQM49217.1 sugar phosphate isomerase/epimerase family protein [Candidatus Hydrogenedentota bacterium]